jgi:hypothetical protein
MGHVGMRADKLLRQDPRILNLRQFPGRRTVVACPNTIWVTRKRSTEQSARLRFR